MTLRGDAGLSAGDASAGDASAGDASVRDAGIFVVENFGLPVAARRQARYEAVRS